MKKYNVTVNGTVYEVEVEEVGAASSASAASAPTPAPAAAAPAPAAPAVKKEAAPAPAPTAVSAGAATVECPMPGTVLDIKVSVGDQVQAGQVLLILEAMKMENEISAPSAGTIDSIQVQKGASPAGDRKSVV